MKKVESFQNRFNYVLNLRGLRQVDVVNATGLSKEIIHKYCIGTAKPKLENLIILSRFLNINETWLMGYDVPLSKDYLLIKPIRLPILGKISAGVPIFADENIEGYEYAPLTMMAADKEYFFLRVQGNSMNLKFDDGDLVLVEQSTTIEDGDIGVFLIKDEEATVKRFRQLESGVALEPMSTDQSYRIQLYRFNEVKPLGKVVSYISKV